MSRPIHLLDLVSREKLERILHVFTEVAGVASIITYADGHPITQPHHFTPFCLDYCRSTQRGRSKCYESDRHGGMESARLKAPYIYKCLNSGLIDCAAPVIVEGHHLATILAGQVLEEPIDAETAIERAKAIGIEDIEGYLRELARVPLMSRQRLLHIVNLMAEITGTISELALQKHIAQKRSQQYLSRLINSVPDCIISTNADNTVSMVNQAGAMMFGHQTDQMIGRTVGMLLADEESRATYRNNVESRASCKWRADLTAARADGSTFPVQVFFSAINDRNERSAGYVGVIRDVSEEKRLERMKEDLIGMITHDLRNPVLSLERILLLLVNGALGPLNDAQKNVMELALVTSHQLFGMVSDILDIYRKENGKFALRRAHVSIQQILEDSLNQVEFLAREKRLTLRFEPLSPPLQVMVDQDRVRRTCINLLDNAIKYSPEGGHITVRMQRLNRGEGRQGLPLAKSVSPGGMDDGRDMLLINVEDEGIGIPEQYHQSIFDKYFTIKSNEVTCRDGGVGLGLAFCRQVIEAHSGRIWVESPLSDNAAVLRRGCRFCFTLPYDFAESTRAGWNNDSRHPME